MTVAEVAELLDLMKARGVSHLKMGDLELTMAQAAPDPDAEKKGRIYSKDEIEQKARADRRRVMLGASGGIIGRASGE